MSDLESPKRKSARHWSRAKKTAGRFALIASLRRFLRDRITVEQAREKIKSALERRQETFLELARTQYHSGVPLRRG